MTKKNAIYVLPLTCLQSHKLDKILARKQALKSRIGRKKSVRKRLEEEGKRKRGDVFEENALAKKRKSRRRRRYRSAALLLLAYILTFLPGMSNSIAIDIFQITEVLRAFYNLDQIVLENVKNKKL